MAKSKKKDDPYVRCFEVCDPQLHQKGFTIYKVIQKSIKVDAPEEDVKEIVVWRRYNDFKKLYKSMVYLHKALHRKEQFPPFAAAKMFGRFESTVIKERQQSAQDLLNFVGQKHYLVNSKAFTEFFEGGEMVVVNPHGDPILEPLRLSEAETHDADEDNVSVTSSDISGMDDQWLSSSLTEDDASAAAASAAGLSLLDYPEPELTLPSPPAQTPDAESLPRVDTEPELGGVWQFRQAEDLGSLDDDDIEENGDQSDNSKPNYLDMFDPFSAANVQNSSAKEKDDNWLADAMSQLQPGEGAVSLDDEDLQLPLPPTDDLLDSTGTEPESQELDSQADATAGTQNSTEMPSHTSSLSEFDPLSSPAAGKIQCGRGDMPFNLLETPTSPSLPASPPADAHPTDQACQLPKPAQPSPIKSPKAAGHSPGPSPSKQALYLDLEEKGQYIIEAAKMISLAQQCEANANYHMAFTYYKNGVGLLISGVQGDDNTARRDVVRRKTAKYLLKAEDIYNKHLAPKGPNDNRWDTEHGGQLKHYAQLQPEVACLQGPVSDLAYFRVLGVINTVLLVYDSTAHTTCVMKVLRKTVNVNSQYQTIVPNHCPFMVQLIKFYESDSAIFLVLQHATGGTLWSYISSYLHQHNDSANKSMNVKEIKSPCKREQPTPVSNVYAGHRYTLSSSVRDKDSKIDSIGAMKTDNEVNTAAFDCGLRASKPDPAKALQHDSLCDISVCDTNDNQNVIISNSDAEFNVILKETKPAIEYFSINSFDSDSDKPSTSRFDSTTSDNIESIPEVNESLIEGTDSPSNGVFENGSPSNSLWERIQKVENILDEAERDVLVVGTNHEAAIHSGEMITSTPRKLPDNCDTDSIDEPSIYDLHKGPDQDNLSTDDSLSKFSDHDESNKDSQESDATEVLRPDVKPVGGNKLLVFRHSSQERSLPGSTEGRPRQRTLSGAFAGLDLAGDSGEDASQSRNTSFHLPEGCVRQWIAEIVVALANLHALGITCRDLRPDNILLGERGHILLSYFSQWACTDHTLNPTAIKNLYTAPELTKVGEVTEACDWWSLGVIMFELITGMSLSSCYPSGVNSHTVISIPDHVSPEAHSLLLELLCYNPQERLGAGVNGFEDIRLHPFFNGIEWATLVTYNEDT